MANLNKVLLMGNLTRDPELRFTPKGTALAQLGLAVNRRWKDETGQMKEEVTFIDVTAFGAQAENIGKYFKKGRPIFIEGRLRLDSWDDKQTNQKRSKLSVVLESFQFVDSGNREGAAGQPTANAPATAAQPSRPVAASASTPPPPPVDEMPPEDDVPF